MSNDEFETWLSLVGRLLGLNERQRKLIGEELRDHLESRVADLLESGMDKKSAVMQAVEEFGDAAVLAKNLQSVSLENRKRWMMRFMTFATAGVFLFALLTMAMWPENARFGAPSRTVAQDQEDPFGNDETENTDSSDPFGPDDSAIPLARRRRAVPKLSPSARTVTNTAIREKLNQKHDLLYDSQPFEDVLAFFRELQINIIVDVHLEGILDADTEISANLTGIRLADGLRMMLKDVDATYAIQNGVLKIISIDDEGEPEFLSRHMIEVGEVLSLINSSERSRIGKPIADFHAAPGGFSSVQRGGGGVFCVSPQGLGGGSPTQEQIAVETTVDSEPKVLLTAEHLLIETITRVVSSDFWQVNGGGNGDLTCVGGVLIVVSSESVADEIRDFITDLEYQLKNRLKDHR